MCLPHSNCIFVLFGVESAINSLPINDAQADQVNWSDAERIFLNSQINFSNMENNVCLVVR